MSEHVYSGLKCFGTHFGILISFSFDGTGLNWFGQVSGFPIVSVSIPQVWTGLLTMNTTLIIIPLFLGDVLHMDPTRQLDGWMTAVSSTLWEGRNKCSGGQGWKGTVQVNKTV